MEYEIYKRLAETVIKLVETDLDQKKMDMFLKGFHAGSGYDQLPERYIVRDLVNFYNHQRNCGITEEKLESFLDRLYGE